MALRFMDGFDSYVTADLAEKWSSVVGAITAGQGRRGTASLRLTTNPIGKNLDNQPTWIIGFAFRFTAYANTDILRFLDGSTQQAELRLLIDGKLQLNNNGTVRGATTYPVLALNTYHYIECQVTVHNTTGSATVLVDGATVLALTNIDTQTTGNAYAGNFTLGPGTSLGTLDIDDVYVCDGTGSVNNTPLGDCRIDTLFPNGDGSNSAWSLSTGATHSTLVDETAPNDDTDYILTSTAAARDTHTLGNLPAITSPTIRGIQHSISARKDDAGTRQIKSCLKSGATTQTHATTHTLSTSYLYYTSIWETDPNTTAAWTTAAIDALEAGVENQ